MSVYRRFPAATSVGDVVVFRDCGAYTLEMMNPYNARPRAAAVAVTQDGEARSIRRRETDEELMAHDVAPGFEQRLTPPVAGLSRSAWPIR